MASGAFLCPTCGAPRLAIGASMDFEPDSLNDDITLQVVRCGGCGLEAVALYRESRRGSLDGEAFSHDGYFADKAALRALTDAVKACPSPRDSSCQCAGHGTLGARDACGAWDGLRRLGIDRVERFVMAMAQ